ncbi:MAG TPA: methyltransferase domain-containing protein [Actinomycetota bacterium]|nr:methyltransferase domain-containing protein [Actinomycetota bacterium]
MAEHPGAERIRRFLTDVSEGGTDVLSAYFEPGVVWHVGRGNPGSGTFRGRDGLIDYLLAQRISPGRAEVESTVVLADDSHGAAFIDVAIHGGGTRIEMQLRQVFKEGGAGRWDEFWILETVLKEPPVPRPGESDPTRYLDQYWYYCVELSPGVFTPGAKHRNLGLTRDLLARCEVTGRRCLDIGTMEAAVPVLMSRREAGQVVAVDVMHCDRKVAVVKHFTGAEFDYHGGLTHQATARFVGRRYGGNFDVVVLSGVLYHCFGPLAVLAMARSLVRTGGLMIVETYAAMDKQDAMYFNARGQLSPDGSTYFLLSVPLLEYLLRYLRLKPLDCVTSPTVDVGGRPSARVAVVCRATNELGISGDAWMESAANQIDYRTLVDWERIDVSGADPPAYGPAASRFVDGEGSCDVTRTAFESPPLDLPERVATIGLEDLY